MTNPINPIPEGFHTVTPYLCVKDAGAAIDFYKAAFGATESYRLTEPSGKIGHAEIKIGDSVLMVAEEFPEYGALSPHTLGGSAVRFSLFVPDCDSVFAQAVSAGGTVDREVTNHSYGERSGNVKDPFGYIWLIGTRVEDVSPEEMQRRYTEMMAENGS